MRRGNEKPKSLFGKGVLRDTWQGRSFHCVFEEGLSDVVAHRSRHGRLRIVCGEYDNTTRNIVRNVSRDFASGCDAVLIAVPDEKLRAAVRRKLRRSFPREIWTKVGVVTLNNLMRKQERNHETQR